MLNTLLILFRLLTVIGHGSCGKRALWVFQAFVGQFAVHNASRLSRTVFTEFLDTLRVFADGNGRIVLQLVLSCPFSAGH